MNHKPSGLVVAIDFETFYRKKTYSVKIQGTPGYLEHPDFDAYLVSIVAHNHAEGPYTPDPDMEFCGHPSEFDWSLIDDPSYIWLSHNKSFDFPVLRHLVEQGIVPEHNFRSEPEDLWFCTADMAAYMGLPRALGNVVKYVFGHEMEKSIRDNMDGIRWGDLPPEAQEEVRNYALEDSRWLHRLWEQFSPHWPDHERRISNMTIEMGWRGLPCDPSKLRAAVQSIHDAQAKAEETIPWPTPEGKTPLSSKALAAQCRLDGVPVPVSRAKDSLACQRWIREYGERAPYVEAMQTWASCNTLITRLKVMEDRCRIDDHFQWGWIPYSLKYCGAHTGRDAGSGGMNTLNLNKSEVSGVNLRNLIQPPPGFLFLNADYSQIEPRVLAWLAGDQEFLRLIREEGLDPYVAFGKATLGHQGEWTSKERQHWKIMVLGLGYGCGADKFVDLAHTYGVTLTREESKKMVDLYRRKNDKVPQLWKRLENELRGAAGTGEGKGTLVKELPSGRPLVYRKVSRLKGLRAVVADEEGFIEKAFWGGVLTENLVQAVSRDIFFEGYLRLEDAGIPNVLRIYDEFLAIVLEDEAEEKAKLMEELMTIPPTWAPDLPIGAEVKILTRYEK